MQGRAFLFLLKSLEAFIVWRVFCHCRRYLRCRHHQALSGTGHRTGRVDGAGVGGRGRWAGIAAVGRGHRLRSLCRWWQSFTDGLNRLIAMLMRVLLPLTLLVLLVYLAFIPFN
ncbi:MAG: hypothetical protein R2838_15480 [Caldilineaceae bacterium]